MVMMMLLLLDDCRCRQCGEGEDGRTDRRTVERKRYAIPSDDKRGIILGYTTPPPASATGDAAVAVGCTRIETKRPGDCVTGLYVCASRLLNNHTLGLQNRKHPHVTVLNTVLQMDKLLHTRYGAISLLLL